MITRLAKKFLKTNKNRLQGHTGKPIQHSLLTKSIFQNFGKFNKEQVSIHREELCEFNENTLWDLPGKGDFLTEPGAKKKKKIKGRGRASGKGKTSGFGHKGQGQRRTKKHPRFEGGQNPLYNRLPKIRLRQIDEVYEYITIERLLYGIKRDWINPENEITIKDLVDSGLITKPTYGVILKSKGHEKLNIPLRIEVSEAESSAIEALQSQGGSVAICYRTRAKLSQHLQPEKRSKYILEDPIPPTHKLQRFAKLYKMGCDMRVKFPDWLLEDLEAGKEIEEFHREFEFPVKRYPGMGKDRIRKRKEVIERTIKFDFLNK